MPPRPPNPRRAWLLIHALVACGGVAALSWEVLWQLEASLALGVSARGTAITLAATMAGMTVGALLAGRWLSGRELAAPLRVYGGLEGVIGLSGLLLVPGFGLLEALDSRLWSVSPALAPLVHLLGIALLLGPPTVAMGATIPVLARVARSHRLSLAGLYGMNTIGAAGGVLLIAFLLIPALGVRRTCFLVAGINGLVLVVARLLAPAPSEAEADGGDRAAAPGLDFRLAGLAVFCTGFVTFALEVAWFRSLRAAFQSVTDSFAIMLFAVLVPLGVGARLVPRLRSRGLHPRSFLAVAALVILLVTPLVERMDLISAAWTDVERDTYALQLLKRLALCLGTLGPAMLALGMVLPWLLEEFPDAWHCGRLYGINTAGSVFGSLAAAWLFLPTLGFARTAWVLGAGVLVLALALQVGGRRWLVAAAGAGALALAVLLGSSPGRDRVPGTNAALDLEIVAYDEGPDATAAVVADRATGARALVIDGFIATQEGSWGVRYMDLMGRLPMLAHPDPERALVICFGTGQTTNAVREEGPKELDVIELSPAVLGMAPHFRSNEGVLNDPRVRAVAMDGRAWLRRTDERYDVMTLEPMPPYFAGVNALYSRDFYEIMAEKLEPGGIVAQWVPLHLLPPFHAASVAAAFRAVFPDSFLWMGEDLTGILIGGRAGEGVTDGSEWPGLERGLGERPIKEREVRQGVVLPPEALARYAALGTVITDDNQELAYGSLRRDLIDYGPEMINMNVRLILRIVSEPGWKPVLPPPVRLEELTGG